MKPKLKSKLFLAGLFGCMLSATASASLVYDSSIRLSAQGFGTAPRDLSVQATGSVTSPESGCVGVSSTGGIVVGTSGCRGSDATIGPNGVVSVGGNEPNPLSDNQKYGIPTLASRDITNLSQLGILFNATEPNGDAITVTDLTLKFYSGGTFLASINGSQEFLSSFAGNGVAGFVFVIDVAQQLALANVLAGFNFGSLTLALESTLTGSSGGPETFRVVNINGGGSVPPQEIPEPGSLALIGLALAGLAAARRRKV